MAGEVVEGAAGGHDVDEAEQRGAQLGVLRRRGPSPCRRARAAAWTGRCGRAAARSRPTSRTACSETTGTAPTIPTVRAAGTGRGRGSARIAPCGSPSPPTSAPGSPTTSWPSCAPAATSRSRTARWPARTSATTGPGAPRRRRATSPTGARTRASCCCWTGTGASIAANKVAGRARRALRRRGDGRGRAALERRERARASACGRPREAELGEILDAWFAAGRQRRRRRRGERRPPRRHPVSRGRARGRILIDARAAARPELGGVERWARELERAAARARARPLRVARAAGRARPRRRATLWEQAVLPLRAARERAPLVLCPANLAPVAGPHDGGRPARRRAAARARAGTRGPTSPGSARCCRCVARRARVVITVSAFSRDELVDLLGARPGAGRRRARRRRRALHARRPTRARRGPRWAWSARTS